MFDDMDDDGIPLPDWLPTLDRGRHVPNQARLCAMEAAAWLSGEERSDRPRSVHPVIAQVARVANDTLPDDERQGLWPLVVASLDTNARWRPVLWYRLMRYGLISQRRYPGNPRKVWEELLKEHARLTGRKTMNRRKVLAAPLRVSDDESLDLVGAGTASSSVSR